MSKYRYLSSHISELCFGSKKMAFVSGPRQSGKTTMAKRMLSEHKVGQYYNWDSVTFRKQWTLDPNSLVPGSSKITPLMVLDEIHKQSKWKRQLKGMFDTLEHDVDILVTGSAHLNVYRKGSDSLLGRYFHFTLHPFSLNELIRLEPTAPSDLIEAMGNTSEPTQSVREHFSNLLEYGPFPEPLFAQNARAARIWRRSRTEQLIREDLRDMTRLPELAQVEVLSALLPDRVGSLLSFQSIARDMEVSSPTIKRWLQHLTNLYYCFLVMPYHRNIARAVVKSPRLYLWDWAELADPGKRLENMVASHLFKYCQFCTDVGYTNLSLCYLRNRQQQEIDFLLTMDNQPWLAVEVKSKKTDLSPHWSAFLPQMPSVFGVQLTTVKNYFKHYCLPEGEVIVMDIERFLSLLV